MYVIVLHIPVHYLSNQGACAQEAQALYIIRPAATNLSEEQQEHRGLSVKWARTLLIEKIMTALKWPSAPLAHRGLTAQA